MKKRDSMAATLSTLRDFGLRAGVQSAFACSAAGTVRTGLPGSIFCRPSSTTRSPGARPAVMSHSPLMARSAVTTRSATLSSAPTTMTVASPRGLCADAALRHQQRRWRVPRVSRARTNMPGSSSRSRIRKHRAQHDRPGATGPPTLRRTCSRPRSGIRAAVFEREADFGLVRRRSSRSSPLASWRCRRSISVARLRDVDVDGIELLHGRQRRLLPGRDQRAFGDHARGRCGR